MTTAFVLGGGGVLGAVEVGMLRALFERDIVPDLVLGTSIGAFNGAMVASQPELGVVERLTELWQVGSERRREACYGDRPLRTVRRAVASGTHLWSAEPLRQRLAEELGDLTFEELPVTVPGLRGQHRALGRALVQHRPGRGRGGRQRRRTGAAAAGRGRRRALPRRRHRELDPARPGGRARRHPGLRAAGRPARPAAHPPKRPWEVARVSFEIARRHRFVRELAELPDDVECHVLPARGTSARDDTLLGSRDFSGVQARIDATYDASLAYLDEHSVKTAVSGDGCCSRDAPSWR